MALVMSSCDPQARKRLKNIAENFKMASSTASANFLGQMVRLMRGAGIQECFTAKESTRLQMAFLFVAIL